MGRHFRLIEYLRLLLLTVIVGAAIISEDAVAATNAGITYQGRILKPDGSPLEGATVQFRMQIRTPGTQNCLMFEEVQTQDMRNSKGNFALTINDGNGTRTDATGFGLDRVFANRTGYTFDPATCATGSTYTPNVDDGRKLVVYFKDETMSTWEPMPAQNINFVPFAMETKQIAGFGINDLLRFDIPASALKNMSPLNEAQYDKLMALIAGSSTDYERAGRLGGVALPPLGAGQAGQVLSWTGSSWTASDTVPADSITSAKIVNGTIVGADLASNIAITTTNTISTSGTVQSNITTARDFRIYDLDIAPNENYISFKAPASLPSNFTYTWPASYGTANQVLTTDGTGALTWAAPAAASQWSNGTGGAIYYNGGNVGVGTATPASPLEVVAPATNPTAPALRIATHPTAASGEAVAVNTSQILDGGVVTPSVYAMKNEMITGNGFGATFIYGVSNQMTFNSSGGIGGEIIGTNNVVGLAPPSGTVQNAYGTKNVVNLTDAGVVTSAYGSYNRISRTAGTIANGYGVYIAPIAGTNHFGLYQEGTTDTNYFGGSVGVGTASPAKLLHVRKDQAAETAMLVQNSNSAGSAKVAVFSSPTYGEFASYGSANGNATRLYSNGGALEIVNEAASGKLSFQTGATPAERMVIASSGKVGVGVATPTATLHLAAGTAAAGTSPLKLTSGPVMTTPEAGAIEYDGTSLFYTDSTNTRRTLGVAGAGITALTGDVTASGTGSAAATVAQVGGVTAANVASGANLANAATAANTIDTIVKRDSTGSFVATSATLNSSLLLRDGAAGGSVTLAAPTGFTSYGLTLPATAGTSGQVLSTNGSGVLSWLSPITASTGFVNGGNSFGAAASLGTNDNFDLNFKTNNSAKMTILANGNVGVGTTSPTAKLMVAGDILADATGSSTASPRLLGVSQTAGQASRWYFGDSSNAIQNAYNSRMQMYSYWGIELAGNRGINGALGFQTGAATDASVNVINSRTTSVGLAVTAVGGQTANLQEWRNSAGTALSVVDSTGNFGIGKTSAGYKLDVNGAVNATQFLVNGTDISTSAGAWTVASGNAYRTTGNVGVGTSAPTFTLHANGIVAGASTTNPNQAATIGPAGASGNLNYAQGYLGLNAARVGTNWVTNSDGTNSGGAIAFGDIWGNFMVAPIPTAGNVTQSFTDTQMMSKVRLSVSGTGVAVNTPNAVSALSVNGGISAGTYYGTAAPANGLIVSGNVGIGTSSPGTTLDVNGTILGRTMVNAGSSGQNGAFNVFSNTGSLAGTLGGTTNGVQLSSTSAGKYLAFSTNDTALTERMRIDSTGNVGIGKTAPGYKLDVNGAINATQLLVNGVDVSSGSGAWTVASGNAYRSSGNVGVGTAAPMSQLEVANYTVGPSSQYQLMVSNYTGDGGSAGIAFKQTDNPDGSTHRARTLISAVGGGGFGNSDYLSFALSSAADNTSDADPVADSKFAIRRSGNVGIGTISPSEKLHVAGNVIADSYLYTSDRRLKKDITPIQSALDKVLSLNGVAYRWIRPTSKEADRDQIGLIAQDVELVFPEAVTVSADGYKRVNYPMLVAPVVEAIKSLHESDRKQARSLASLEERAVKAEAKVEELRRKLEAKDAEFEARLRKLESALSKQK